MIIEIAPGLRTRLATDADFIARIETPFSTGQLSGVTPYMEYRKFDGVSGQVAGTVSGTEFLFDITPGLFTPGEWTVNFTAVVTGKKRRWASPAILVFGDPLVEDLDCNCD